MPRTKQVKKALATQVVPQNLFQSKVDSQENEEQELLDELKRRQKECMKREAQLLKKIEELRKTHEMLAKQDRLAIPIAIRNKTMQELREGGSNFLDSLSSTTLSFVRSIATPNFGKKTSKDDGYSSSDSRAGTSGSGARRSRPTKRSMSATRSEQAVPVAFSAKPSRKSRSISAPKKEVRNSSSARTQPKRDSSSNKYKTPSNTKKMESIGTITPKVNPYKPQVIIRRPVNGEIAVSMQGSPLLTTGMVSETVANVNVPLPSGRMITVQPMAGLRRSQVPELDADVKMQLRLLKENIEKLCGPL